MSSVHSQINKGISSIERRFIITPHARQRISERFKEYYIEFDKLRPITAKEVNSKFFRRVNRIKNKTTVYFTDGEKIFVTQSKRAAEYIIITVL